jgi:hypothetical protein
MANARDKSHSKQRDRSPALSHQMKSAMMARAPAKNVVD